MPIDYKVYCFNGEPKAILVCEDRTKEESGRGVLKMTRYDLDWNVLDVGKQENRAIEKPNCLEKMIEYSRLISKPFPFVRVDFYDSFGEVFLGEMTFTPTAGIAQYYNEKGLQFFGNLLKLE